MIDGSSVTYPWLPTNIAYVPPAEAIETVNVVTNAFNAEQGLAGGAAVNVIIKSGTNALHGSGWIFDTNSHFKARNFFQTTPQNPTRHTQPVRLHAGWPDLASRNLQRKKQALLLCRLGTDNPPFRFGAQFLPIPTVPLRAAISVAL